MAHKFDEELRNTLLDFLTKDSRHGDQFELSHVFAKTDPDQILYCLLTNKRSEVSILIEALERPTDGGIH
jgi:hypothetical protein